MLTVSEAISMRRSVRTFTNDRPSGAILQECGAGRTPYVRLITSDIGGGRVGTYGVIKGTPAYVAVVYDKENVSDSIRAGIEGERFVLECTRRGLGTCWLGGTFSRSDVRAVLHGIPGGAGVGCVIAVGHPAERPGLVERIMRKAVGADNRRPLSELVVAGAVPDHLLAAMEAVRRAPSATNRQPWRFAFCPGGSVDVYGDRRDPFMTLDVGIALCHFLAIAPQYALSPPENNHPTLAPLASMQLKM